MAKERNTSRFPNPLGQAWPEAWQKPLVRKEFSRALRRARKAFRSGKSQLAVEWCRYAASLAWGVNPGFFYSPEAEQLLAEIGRKYFGAGATAEQPSSTPKRFLHLMTMALPAGGHTRVVSRWIEICARCAPWEHHSIVITFQEDQPIPAWLGQSAKKTGGELVVLPSGLSWLQAAEEVRTRAMDFDAIVLHVHPNDPLPNLAFYDHPRPLLFFRHADHVFNLALDTAQAIAEIRFVGYEMSHRFLPRGSSKVIIPIPLIDDEPDLCNKAEARRKLGLPADASIVMTVGWPYKFISIIDCDFSQAVRALCEANPRVYVVAVGPTESDLFPGLSQAVGGRYLPTGPINDRNLLELYYRSADVYVDAYPSGSLTATLDAARHALPVQRLRNRHFCLFWSDDPALDSVMLGASTQDEFIATVLEWLEWPEEKRLELGSRFRTAVLRDHCGESWKSKWLDPAVSALASSDDSTSDAETGNREWDEARFPGLGVAGPERDWPAGMFVAGTIFTDEHFPRPIRISGVFHSIKPLFFHMSGEGTVQHRLTLLTWLIASCVPYQIRSAPRRLCRSILKKLGYRPRSTR